MAAAEGLLLSLLPFRPTPHLGKPDPELRHHHRWGAEAHVPNDRDIN